jgi:hypothetical protein
MTELVCEMNSVQLGCIYVAKPGCDNHGIDLFIPRKVYLNRVCGDSFRFQKATIGIKLSEMYQVSLTVRGLIENFVFEVWGKSETEKM